MLKNTKVGFIGAGQMCEAILAGALQTGVLTAANVTVCDVNTGRLADLAEQYGVATMQNGADGQGAARLAAGCALVVVSIKPQFVREVLSAAAGGFGAGTLVVSIVGGVTIETLRGMLPKSPVIRVMPNTPMMVRRGAAGIAPGPDVSDEQMALCRQLFDAVGQSFVLPESQLDALTAVSGCGPAYAYLFIEAMADGGVEQGLPRQLAQTLAAQALAGAAQMVLESGEHPGRLKDNVTSPGGGTIAGVHALERGAFRATVMDAVAAARKRMQELG